MKSVVCLFGLLYVFNFICHVICEPPSVCTRCLQSTTCKLPDCFCCREDLHLPIPIENIPQIVFFTFDDAVTDQVAGFYKQLFDSKRKNPNGCPITMTLFISHDNTKYRLVQEFYEKGMEIASHSVTHSTMNGTNFYEEAKMQKENLAKLANIPVSEITGWRSPFLKPTGDLQPDSLKKLGYSYDATLTYSKRSFREKPPGPFTLDFGFPYECQVKPCPRNKHPGFWEVPVVSLMDYQHKYDCVYVDGCMNAPPDEDAAYQFLWDNFHSYYTQTRMPFGINMHPSWFFYPDRFKAMDRFIRKLVSMNDVYIVSASRMLEWLKYPTPLQDLRSFTPWACDGSEKRLGGASGVRKNNPRRFQSRMTSWGSRTAGMPRRYFTPRVMYPASSLYSPRPTARSQGMFTSRSRESLRPGIYTLSARELEGRPPLYPANIQLSDRLHRQRLRDRNGDWPRRVSPSMAPRIATISMERLLHTDMANNRVENLPNIDLPSPFPSPATRREILDRRHHLARQQNLAEQERQQALENMRQRRIQRLQRQRHRDLMTQQKQRELALQQQDLKQLRTRLQDKKPTRLPETVPTLSSATRKKSLEKRLQKTIIWKPALLDNKKGTEQRVSQSTARQTAPPEVYQETVMVWPRVTKAPIQFKKGNTKTEKQSSKNKQKTLSNSGLAVDELTNFIQKIESQTNAGHTKLKPIPTQVPARQSTRPVWVRTRMPSRTAKPSFTPSIVNRRQSITAATSAPPVLESPMARERRIQAQHLRRANETLLRQREREERIRRQQILQLRERQRAARRNRLQSDRSRMQQDFTNRQFIPNVSIRPRPRSRSMASSRLVDGPMFTTDVLHPSVAQRIAWNRFIRRMLGGP